MATALARGRGENFVLAGLRAAIDRRGYLREDATRKLTSREVLRCELELVMAARGGRRRFAPFATDFTASPALSAEQRAAVSQILGSRDFVTLFRGGAGTGKSFALKEVERGLVGAGQSFVVLAPQRQQVYDLQKDGLAAQTLAQLLVTKRLPLHAVVMVDEAGQIGGWDLHALMRLVQTPGAGAAQTQDGGRRGRRRTVESREGEISWPQRSKPTGRLGRPLRKKCRTFRVG